MLPRFAPFGWPCSALALAAMAWAVPCAAQSEPAPVKSPEVAPLEIRWSGPEDCERGDAVRAKVLRLLGGSRRALAERFEVSVKVRREAATRYVAELETTSATGSGKKRLEGESCDAIALASSVVIALSIDPEARLDAEEPPPEPAPPPPPKRETPAPAPRPAPVARERRNTKPYLHGSVGVLFGLLNEPSAFTGAGIGVRHHLVSLELGGAVYQARDVFRVDRPKVGAVLRLFTGDLLGCYAALPFQLGAFEVCLGGRVDYLSASAFGVSNPDEGKVLLVSGLGVARGRLRATSWLSATLDAGVSAHPFHPTFVLVGVGDVFEIPLVSPFARTGLAVEF